MTTREAAIAALAETLAKAAPTHGKYDLPVDEYVRRVRAGQDAEWTVAALDANPDKAAALAAYFCPENWTGSLAYVPRAALRTPVSEAGLDVERLARAMWDGLSYAGVLRIHADGWKELNDLAVSVAAEYERHVPGCEVGDHEGLCPVPQK